MKELINDYGTVLRTLAYVALASSAFGVVQVSVWNLQSEVRLLRLDVKQLLIRDAVGQAQRGVLEFRISDHEERIRELEYPARP